jgi:hypothetical protein
VKFEKTATETFSLLCKTYGENAISRATVSEWHKTFSERREDAEDVGRIGRAVTTKTY